MKKTIVLLLASACALQAQTVHETFHLGDVFATGTNRGGDYFSQNARFPSTPNGTTDASSTRAGGLANDVRALAGNPGGINFVAGSSTRVLLDLGNRTLTETSIDDARFVDSKFTLIDIDQVNYSFKFEVEFLNGTKANSLADLNYHVSGGTANITQVGQNLFNFHTTSITGGGFSSSPTGVNFEVSSNTGSAVRLIDLTHVNARGAYDNVRLEGSRKLEISPVPEPSSALLLGLGALATLLHRKRSK